MSIYDIHSSTRNTIVSTGEYIVSIVPLVLVLFPVENIYASDMPPYLSWS